MRLHISLVALLTACAPSTEGADSTSDAQTAAPPDSAPPVWPDAGPPPPGGHLLDTVDQLSLVIVVGDSIAAGYNGPGQNGASGQGYARLLVDNHGAYPAYAGHDLHARWPQAAFADLADSGANSDEALAAVQGALNGGGLPASVPGDVLVLINVGGNDFNDSPAVMIDAELTAERAATLHDNLVQIIQLLADRYHDPAGGKLALFLVNDIHDPTDGMGTVPAQFHEGFCDMIQNPIFSPALREQALTNLDTMNAAIAGAAGEQGATLIGVHANFLGRGMNGGSFRLLDDDCAHPTGPGHDFLRQLSWDALTGERY